MRMTVSAGLQCRPENSPIISNPLVNRTSEATAVQTALQTTGLCFAFGEEDSHPSCL